MSRFLPAALDRSDALPLAEQIVRYYRQIIEDGGLRQGERLPAIRMVAEASGVTRATVEQAYRQLGEQGLVRGTVGRGTTVLARPAAPQGPLSSVATSAVRQLTERPGSMPLPADRDLVADFAELSPDVERFPVADLRAAIDTVLAERAGELLSYAHEASGLPELRELLVGRCRSVDPTAQAGDFLITAGGQQGLDLLLRTICGPGDAVVVTSPSYHQMAGLMTAHGLSTVSVPWSADGFDFAAFAAAVQRSDVRLCYLMPTFHNPTGRSLSLKERHQLMDILRQTQIPLVEDEYQHELRFAGEALPSLRQLDERGLTVTVSTFSKGLFPGLRVGWVQGSPQLLQPMAAVKRFVDLETSPLLQAALVELAARGAIDRCLASVREHLGNRHLALRSVFAAELPDGCQWTQPEGGYVAWLELPHAGQGDRLAEMVAERGVRVAPGRMFEPDGRPSRGLRLSLSRVTEDQVLAGARILSDAARELLQGSGPASQSFL